MEVNPETLEVMADIASALYIQFFLNAWPPSEYLFYLQTFNFK